MPYPHTLIASPDHCMHVRSRCQNNWLIARKSGSWTSTFDSKSDRIFKESDQLRVCDQCWECVLSCRVCSTYIYHTSSNSRADSRFVRSQWETVLLCNDVSHWLGTSLESALDLKSCGRMNKAHLPGWVCNIDHNSETHYSVGMGIPRGPYN